MKIIKLRFKMPVMEDISFKNKANSKNVLTVSAKYNGYTKRTSTNITLNDTIDSKKYKSMIEHLFKEILFQEIKNQSIEILQKMKL